MPITRRTIVWIAIVLAGCCAGASSVLAQAVSLRFPPPPSFRAVGGNYTVRWEDLGPEAFAVPLTSITWYYATDPNGTDKQRITSFLREDFVGFRRNWRVTGPFPFDWEVRGGNRNNNRSYLTGTKFAAPIVSLEPLSRDCVVSLLVRSSGIKSEWGMELRATPPRASFEFRHDGNLLKVLDAGRVIGEIRVPELRSRQWHWYDVGLRTRRSDVEIRVQVLNEERTQSLAAWRREVRPSHGALLKEGLISLHGPAEFAEMYVDPWGARWVDDPRNEFRWNTADVPDGDYYVLADVIDSKGQRQTFSSGYRIEVRNMNRAATD